MEQTMTKTKNETKEKKRDIGLDALRIISMIMILFLHYLGKGGLLEWANNSQFYNVLYYGIEAACIVAVNCYVLISGYFLLHAKFRWKKLFKLWGEVFFYSVAIYLMIVGVGLKEFEMKEMIKCLFPILTKQYWFVSVYFMLYALSPFLNKLIFALNQKEHKTLLAILILGFSVVSFLPSGYTLDGTGGYSIIWFVCLYLIATYLRQYGIPKWIHIKRWGWVYLGCTMIIAGGMILIEYVCQKTGRNSFAPKLLQYNNLFVLIESIALFLWFQKLNIKSRTISKVITFVAPLTFAVYLIHEQPQLRTILYDKILHTSICYHNPYSIAIVILNVFIIFTICIMIEYFRKNICKRIEKIRKDEK